MGDPVFTLLNMYYTQSALDMQGSMCPLFGGFTAFIFSWVLYPLHPPCGKCSQPFLPLFCPHVLL